MIRSRDMAYHLIYRYNLILTGWDCAYFSCDHFSCVQFGCTYFSCATTFYQTAQCHLVSIDPTATHQSSTGRGRGSRLFFRFEERSDVRRSFESEVRSLRVGGAKNNQCGQYSVQAVQSNWTDGLTTSSGHDY